MKVCFLPQPIPIWTKSQTKHMGDRATTLPMFAWTANLCSVSYCLCQEPSVEEKQAERLSQRSEGWQSEILEHHQPGKYKGSDPWGRNHHFTEAETTRPELVFTPTEMSRDSVLGNIQSHLCPLFLNLRKLPHQSYPIPNLYFLLSPTQLWFTK